MLSCKALYCLGQSLSKLLFWLNVFSLAGLGVQIYTSGMVWNINSSKYKHKNNQTVFSKYNEFWSEGNLFKFCRWDSHKNHTRLFRTKSTLYLWHRIDRMCLGVALWILYYLIKILTHPTCLDFFKKNQDGYLLDSSYHINLFYSLDWI